MRNIQNYKNIEKYLFYALSCSEKYIKGYKYRIFRNTKNTFICFVVSHTLIKLKSSEQLVTFIFLQHILNNDGE